MSNEPGSRDYYRQVGLLSQQVAVNEKLLSDSSCMSPDMRLVYCLLAKINDLFPNPAFKDFIDQKALPLIKAIGFGTWKRDIVSDMGLRIGIRSDEEFFNLDAETDAKPREDP